MNTKKELPSVFNNETAMKEVCNLKSGAVVMGAWSRDIGTMERRLQLAVVYPNKEVSPIREYQKSKLRNQKALNDLADLDGVAMADVEVIFKEVVKKEKELGVETNRENKCSINQAYQALCEYVELYEEPGRVFIKDGYGNIRASYLQDVLDRLDLGYSRLELQKNFRTWGLLRTNQGTGHVYAYKINTGSANDWYFSFKLPRKSEGVA